MKRIALALFLSAALNAEACINGTNRIRDLTFPTVRGGLIEKAEVNPTSLKRQKDGFLTSYKNSGRIEYLADYGVTLLLLKEPLEALKAFKEVERKLPGQYATAANMGTAYELLGQPDSALLWISKAVKLDPGSHEGSEWIHVKILEHKLNPNPDQTPSLLGLDFGSGAAPLNKADLDLSETLKQLQYQLGERIYFINPPDAIMGSLFFDYGNLHALQMQFGRALESYGQAEKYGFKGELLEKRKQRVSLMRDYLAAKEEEEAQKATGTLQPALTEKLEVLEEKLGFREKKTLSRALGENILWLIAAGILGFLLMAYVTMVILRKEKLKR